MGLQKATFWRAKGNLLQPKRRPFTNTDLRPGIYSIINLQTINKHPETLTANCQPQTQRRQWQNRPYRQEQSNKTLVST